METFFVMLRNVIIFVLLAIPGYLLVKTKVLKAQDSGVLSKILINVGMPALVFGSTLGLELTGALAKSLIVIGALSAAMHLLMYVTSGWLCGHKENRKTRAMMRFCATFINSGFVGIPLATAVFPDNLEIIAYLTVANIVMNVMMFTLGTYLVSGDKSAISIKNALLTPVVLAFLAGIALNLLGVAKAVPEIVTFTNHLKGLVTPLAMLVVGMKLAEVSLKRLLTSGRMYYVSLLRLVLYPVVGTVAILLLQRLPFFGIGNNGVLGFFMAMAMPSASLAAVFADRYQSDTESAAFFTLGTTIVSVLTIPAIYWVLMIVLG